MVKQIRAMPPMTPPTMGPMLLGAWELLSLAEEVCGD